MPSQDLPNYLREWREDRELSQEALATRIGTTKPQISRLENGERRLTLDWLDRLSRGLGLQPYQMLQPPHQSIDDVEVPKPRFLPLIDSIQAGAWGEVTDPYPKGVGSEYVPVLHPIGPRAFALRVRGTSMEPDFYDGDVITVDPDLAPWPGCFVVAKLDDQEQATFKKYRLRGSSDNRQQIIELVPLNTDWPLLTIDEHNPGRIVGVAVDHHRRLTNRIIAAAAA